MYAQHFGLEKQPFRVTVTGTDVFVGPQTAGVISDLKSALQFNDSAVAITGPIGSGKTTLVTRALETTADDHSVIKLSRMQLDSDDILEQLLEELRIENIPAGTIRRFRAFRKRLAELEAAGTRIFVVVEDAPHLGADTLAELEAVTAADAGDSDGANLILMGDERLVEILAIPALARLQQRIRQRQQIAPLSAVELRGYLRHCFRLVGGDFEHLFEPTAFELLHHLSGGIVRITNNIVDSALTAGATQNEQTISNRLLEQVAKDSYGLSADGFQTSNTPVRDEPADDTEDEHTSNADIPDLIPDISTSTDILDAEPAPTQELTTEPEPTIELVPEPAAPDASGVSNAEEVAEWDRDPTVAELKPDLEALERAMATAHGTPEPELPVLKTEAAEATPAPVAANDVDEVVEIPEITLDNAINHKQQNTSVDTPLFDESGQLKTQLAPGDAEVRLPKASRNSDNELENIAVELARAKSIEDMDDKIAETLFGAELSLAASQALEMPPQTTADAEPDVSAAPDEVAETAATETELELCADTQSSLEVTIADDSRNENAFDPMLASQRLKTVRALNADLQPSKHSHSEPVANEAQEAPVTAPDSIEDQINTSMTQTLQALSIDSSSDADDIANEDEASRSGFFNRFRRSQ